MQRPRRRTMLIAAAATAAIVVAGLLALGALQRADDDADFDLVLDDRSWPARGDRVDDEALLASFERAWTEESEGYGWDAATPTDGARLLYAGEVDGAEVAASSPARDVPNAFIIAEHDGRLVAGTLAEPDDEAEGGDEPPSWTIRAQGFVELDDEQGPLLVGGHLLLPDGTAGVIVSEPDASDPDGWALARVDVDPEEHDGLLLGLGGGGYVELDVRGERRTFALGLVEDAAWSVPVDVRLGAADEGDVALTEPDGARATWALRTYLTEVAGLEAEGGSSGELPYQVEQLATGTTTEGMRVTGHRVFAPSLALGGTIAVIDDGTVAAAVHVTARPGAGDPTFGFAVVQWGDRPLLVYATSASVADVTLQSGGATTPLAPGAGVVSDAEASMVRPFVLTGVVDGVVYPAVEIDSETVVLAERELGSP